MNLEFNPNSSDAKFAQVLVRLDNQDNVLGSILAQALKTNGRVSSLESFRAIMYVLGGIGMLILGGVATAVAEHFIL
jgi:hypothetical protein